MRKSALIYRRGLRQRVASLTLNCNGDFAIRAYRLDTRACGFFVMDLRLDISTGLEHSATREYALTHKTATMVTRQTLCHAIQCTHFSLSSHSSGFASFGSVISLAGFTAGLKAMSHCSIRITYLTAEWLGCDISYQ